MVLEECEADGVLLSSELKHVGSTNDPKYASVLTRIVPMVGESVTPEADFFVMTKF